MPNTNNYGNYELSITCNGAPNHQYTENVITCQDNMTSGTVSNSNSIQYFQITTKSKKDVTFSTCDSLYDTTLSIYSDSLYSTEMNTENNNNNCSSGNQEIYTFIGLDPGSYYVKTGVSTDCANTACFGDYTFSILCSGSYPTAQPSPIPTTDPTQSPTITTLYPTSSPTYTGSWSSWFSGTGSYLYEYELSTIHGFHITNVCVRSGWYIDNIQVGFNNGDESGPYGGSGGDGPFCYNISNPNIECFTSIESLDPPLFRKNDSM